MLTQSDLVVDNAETPANLAADEPSAENESNETTKKSNKSKKKKKPKKRITNDTSDDADTNISTSDPKAEVLEMSHLAPSNEATTPLYQFAGTETGSTTSGDTVAISLGCEQENVSLPGKVKQPRRMRSDNHLLQAPPSNRRVSSRSKHSPKKSSDSSDSPPEATPSSGTAVAPKANQKLAEILKPGTISHIITLPAGHTFHGAGLVETNDGQADKLYVIYTQLDPVEAAKMRMQSMEQQERDIKEKKKLAMEGGRVLGEVEDELELEDTGVRITEGVDSLE